MCDLVNCLLSGFRNYEILRTRVRPLKNFSIDLKIWIVIVDKASRLSEVSFKVKVKVKVEVKVKVSFKLSGLPYFSIRNRTLKCMTCILDNKGEILAYLHLLILYKVTEEYGEFRTAFFWVITQRVMVISLVRNYHYSLRNNPDEHR
jgi:hypothetical protein